MGTTDPRIPAGPDPSDAAPNRQQRRQPEQAPTVNATRFRPLSQRGLHNDRIFVRRCPRCFEAHEFRTAGLRIAPCGLRLWIKARKARGTK